MNLIRHVARLSALATAVAIVASCDTRLPTQSMNPNDDVNRPAVKFTLSAGVNGTVDIGVPLTVSVNGTETSAWRTCPRGSQSARRYSRSRRRRSSRPSPASLASCPWSSAVSKGDKITIRATVVDGATNEKTDSMVVTIADQRGRR